MIINTEIETRVTVRDVEELTVLDLVVAPSGEVILSTGDHFQDRKAVTGFTIETLEAAIAEYRKVRGI